MALPTQNADVTGRYRVGIEAPRSVTVHRAECVGKQMGLG